MTRPVLQDAFNYLIVYHRATKEKQWRVERIAKHLCSDARGDMCNTCKLELLQWPYFKVTENGSLPSDPALFYKFEEELQACSVCYARLSLVAGQPAPDAPDGIRACLELRCDRSELMDGFLHRSLDFTGVRDARTRRPALDE